MLTPNALSSKIFQLVKEGYSQKQAIAIAYEMARKAWREKHPVGKFPSWLTIESRGRNPVSKIRKNPVKKLPNRNYFVEGSLDKTNWTRVAVFAKKNSAFEYVKALSKKYPFNYYRVRT